MMKDMNMKKIATFVLLTVTIATFSIAAFAQSLSLEDAKARGLVGERPDGMIGAVSTQSPDVAALIAKINTGRMEVYRETAAKQNLPVSQVQTIAAQKLMDSARPGQYIYQNGNWIQK